MFVPVILCAVPFGWNGKETKRGQKKKKEREREERKLESKICTEGCYRYKNRSFQQISKKSQVHR